jgi:hypothetical protein
MRQPYNPFNLADGGPVDPRLGPPGVDTIPAVADGTPINLDGGEYVLPADTTMQLGPEFLDQLVAATHTPVANGPGFANGGWLSGIFGGVPRDRAAQIDAAVDQAGAPSGPAPAPVAVSIAAACALASAVPIPPMKYSSFSPQLRSSHRLFSRAARTCAPW